MLYVTWMTFNSLSLQRKNIYRISELCLKYHANRMASKYNNNFSQESVKYLGHIISKQGTILTLKQKVLAIANVHSSTDVSKVHSFLGRLNHYGKFTKNFTDLCAPTEQLGMTCIGLMDTLTR